MDIKSLLKEKNWEAVRKFVADGGKEEFTACLTNLGQCIYVIAHAPENFGIARMATTKAVDLASNFSECRFLYEELDLSNKKEDALFKKAVGFMQTLTDALWVLDNSSPDSPDEDSAIKLISEKIQTFDECVEIYMYAATGTKLEKALTERSLELMSNPAEYLWAYNAFAPGTEEHSVTLSKIDEVSWE